MWEYLEVATDVSQNVLLVNNSSLNPTTGKRWREPRTNIFPEFINKLGYDGWELVSVTSFGAVDTEGFVSYVFKRPLLVEK